MPLPSFVDNFERNEVDEERVRAFTNESEHFELAFNLFRETGQYVCLLASTTVGQQPTWPVQQAVLGGHLVRMFKLMRFFLEEAIHNRAELLWVISRLLAECVINFRFLVEHGSNEVVDSYLHQSLQHERELREQILSKVASRAGVPLPIESRMLASIQRTFDNSGVNPDQLPARKIRDWGGKNLFEKAKAVGLDHAYLAIFGGPSRSVHGGWQDLLQNHLNCNAPGEFLPRLEFTAPRPQFAFTLAYLISPSLVAYVKMLGHSDLEPLVSRLSDLTDRVQKAAQLHERFLASHAA